jgi:fibronectin type 3 domain-containing protein
VGIEAVFSAVPRPEAPRGFIDLTWSPSMDADVAGYNVWRRDNGEWRKINAELVKTPAYRDVNIAPGVLEYSVSAVDLRGNESARSEAAREEVPE